MPGCQAPEKRAVRLTETVRGNPGVAGNTAAGCFSAADHGRRDCPLNIILIGMPGAGKSSVGVLLAKRLGYQFVDTDLLMQGEAHCRLQQIIAHYGLAAFKELEEQVECKLA